MKMRYQRNFNMITSEEFNILQEKKVAIIGLGGLGGNILEMLIRFGFISIIAVDYDILDQSNLNRQILSTEENIGESKTKAALKRAEKINSDVLLDVYNEKFTYKLGKKILKDCDIVFDALDNIPSRLELSKVCDEYSIPLVHGAIDGWFGQVGIATKNSHMMEYLYKKDTYKDSSLGNPSFTPAIVAGIQVSEGIKYLLKKGSYLENKVLYIDLFDNMYENIQI
ncbi:MAG: ThiF family adenylyltransferase [Clostridiales bacterium]|nr:ThiF family adenylyltransferase [Clostridiales bacterium]